MALPLQTVEIDCVNDAPIQITIVGIAVHLAGAGIAFYLWTHHRSERFLQFWSLAWAAGLCRWLIHGPADTSLLLRTTETILISVTMIFMVLGSYDLLPSKPWRRRVVVATTALILVLYGATASTLGLPYEMGYALFAAVLAFSAACMCVAYASTRLTGYALAAATLLFQTGLVGLLLSRIGADIADSIIVPLYNIPLMLSIVVIAHQRDRMQLIESENTTRTLYVRLANAEVDERRALHAELHDQVGANLAALRMELDVATRLLSRWDESAARQHLNNARDVATETMAVARDLMADLRPPALDEYGLVAALRTFAETQSARLSLPIVLAGDELKSRPSRVVESALFRIACEAVMNAARHASAQSIQIEVAERDGSVILSVSDDGIGFDPASESIGHDHWGIKNMRERARAVGGVLTLKSAPGAGTTVIAEAPGSDR